MTHNSVFYSTLTAQDEAVNIVKPEGITDEPLAQDAADLEPILPGATTSALQFMIGLSQRLCDLSDKEAEVLEADDFVGVALMQKKKQALANDYTRASQEFHARLEEFKAADKSLLNKLKDLQQTLGNKARANAVVLKEMMDKLQQNTHTTLLNAQSMAQGDNASYGS